MRISYQQLYEEFLRVLTGRNVPQDKAEACARMFTETSLNGVYSHGVNRFPRFIQQLDA
ncbi:Ldh family oxidoreductase, partial [Klebsiella pneumoniae]